MKRQQYSHSALKFEAVLRVLLCPEQQLFQADSLSAEEDELGNHSAEKISMKHRVTAETAIIITKFALTPICCWPPPIGCSSSVNFRHNLSLGIVMLQLIFCIGASVNTIYVSRHDIIRVIKILSELGAVLSVFLKIIICKIEAPRIQFLIAEMQMFLKQATPIEKELIQSYVDKCLMPHSLVFISVVLGPIAFISGPLLTSQQYPGDVIYPFPVESNWLWAAMYLSQSICIVQVGCMVIVDVLFAILLWYAGARFQMLYLEFQSVTNSHELRQCIQKHQEVIGYADKLKISTRIIAVEVTGLALYLVTIGGFILIGDPPVYEMAKYVFFELASAMELFLFTWPADNLIDASRKVGEAAYNCDWIGKSPEMLKNLLIVIQRSKDPIIISVDGLLPALSLEFYGSTMAATFSYLTTLRAMTMD